MKNEQQDNITPGYIETEIEKGPTQSPVRLSVQSVDTEKIYVLTFYDALKEVMNGKKITKREWDDRNSYGFLQDTRLRLHKPDGNYDWILNDGDILGTDWAILE